MNRLKKRIPLILIETTIQRALSTLKDSPERVIRNLIDMALHFSKGRFQKDFFTVAQSMLRNENSAYYELIRDVVTHVDTDKLQTFGINIGYNSCTLGAQRIRDNEKIMGCNIPWAMLAHIDTRQFEMNQQKYEDLIFEGENLGIYTWMFFISDQPEKTLPLVKKHPDSAFCLFCETKDVNAIFIEESKPLNNLMIVVRCDEHAAGVCAELRANQLLYSVWQRYGEHDVATIISGDLLRETQQLYPVFTVLLSEEECPTEVRQSVHSAVKQMRLDQSYRTIVWDLLGDNDLVDAIISEDACSIYFNKNGDLRAWDKKYEYGNYNLLQTKLTDILMDACPKTANNYA